jgi:hypothetical protein
MSEQPVVPIEKPKRKYTKKVVANAAQLLRTQSNLGSRFAEGDSF